MEPLDPEHSFQLAIRQAASAALGIEVEQVPLTYPPTAEQGDLATPVCFELAKVARKAPRVLAQAIVGAFAPTGGIARVEAAGAGYINAYLDRDRFLQAGLRGESTGRVSTTEEKSIVEHTNINPNKAAHIGHLRNAVLGDTLVRCLRRLGRPVEVQNYIDDTGVQVADLVVGFQVLREEGIAEVRERYAEAALRERGERFDYVAWDLYAEVTRFYAEDESRHKHRSRTLHEMEGGDNPTAELAAHVARRMVQHHLLTMERIDVRYDLLPHESDILRLRFWETAFERLKSAGAVHLAERGKNAGCWVMRMPDAEEGAGEDEKVIVRSTGTVTYTGKDIAYQMWKFGLLGRDFFYEPFDWSPQRSAYDLWTTCSNTESDARPAFGAGTTVYNVIDQRQSYPQRVVNQGLRSLGYDEQADRSVHYAYEVVGLTPQAVATIFPGYVLSEEDRTRPYIEMSGRKGLGMRADDLLDKLFDRARDEVARRNETVTDAELDRTARQIAVSALRYYMLRFSRNRVVAFDLDDALAFDGETGPYLQYSVVRAKNILAKVEQAFGPAAVDADALARQASFEALASESAAEHWNLVLQLVRVDAVVAQAVATLELSTLAKHAHVVAQAFNSFYHRYNVVQERDAAARSARVAVVRRYHDGMVELLELMGLSVPGRM